MRIDELLESPVAAAFFVLADADGLGPDRLAEPAVASALASRALWELNPWAEGAVDARTRFLTAAAPLRELCTLVANDPRNAWWSAPLEHASQLCFGDVDPMALATPAGPIDPWETYAQKPGNAIVTSTELAVPADEPIRSGAHAELTHGQGDWHPEYPLRQARVTVAPDARVYEIDSAVDWHNLVLRYGDPATHTGSDLNLYDSAGLHNGLAPTWSAVAKDYDGVHLTFAGLLTALYVPVATGDVSTTLWGWDYESTYWLRPVFTDVQPLEPLDLR